MRLIAFVKARLARRFAIRALGANEARIFYDALISVCAAIAAAVFDLVFLPGGWSRVWYAFLSLPVFILFFNVIFGIYSRLKTAGSRVKAAVLLASVSCSCAAALLLGAPLAAVALWGLLVYGPMALARLLLNLPYSKHRELAAIAVNRRGPVVVIGGAGYIGSHTVELLLREGKRVRVLDRLMYGRESIREFASHPHFELIEGDVTDIAKLTAAMRGASAVIHLAGLVGDPACAVDQEFTRHTNIVATRMAKQIAEAMGVHRFIFASSCSVYGMSDKAVAETGPLNPVSLYAQTKIDSETELLFGGRDDFVVTILRFATVFGGSRRPRFDLVGNLFTAQAMTDGRITVVGPRQWRPFIHVRDLARAIVMVLNSDPLLMQCQVFNVGDKRLNMTILQLAEAVQKITGKYRDVSLSVDDSIQDPRNYAVCFDKIRSTLGFEAATSIQAGIEEIAQGFLQGRYQDYHQEIYSNVAMTAKAVRYFHDPLQTTNLYAPLAMPVKAGS